MTSNDSNLDRHENDLDWLAFCFVANELDSEARAKFEERLADDPAACEAVAQAIELSQMVYRVADGAASEAGRIMPKSRADTVPTDRDGSRSGPKWFGINPRLVFAASVLMTLLAVAWAVNTNRSGNLIAKWPSDDLALTWVDSLAENEGANGGDDIERSELFTDLVEPSVDEVSAEIESDPLFADSELSELGEDNWMLIALAELESANQ